MQVSSSRTLPRVFVAAGVAIAIALGSFTIAADAKAASCDVVDAGASFINSLQYTYHGYAVGCRPYGTDYDWTLTVTSEGNYVASNSGTRYNPGSSWSTSTYTRSGYPAAYCVTFRVWNHATGGFVGSGSDCT
jgi:hypothetical protein